MNNIALLNIEEQVNLFNEVAIKKNIPPAIVEKDFWVCWTLGKFFSDPELSKQLIFKGGTTLSKVFNLIERFSEDIDLILNWDLLTDNNPLANRSKTKQDKFNKDMNKLSEQYISTELLNQISSSVSDCCSATIDELDSNIINISYPSSFSATYILPEIRLEIGPLASWVPFEEYEIKSYAAEEYDKLFTNSTCKVKAIKAERTFWEKATILHHEAHRPIDNKQPLRYSRHYYDLAQMANSRVADSALNDLELLENVVEFKQHFYPRGWAKYELAKAGTFKLIPPEYLLEHLEKDYIEMENMIYGNYPSFQEIMETLQKLENKINALYF